MHQPAARLGGLKAPLGVCFSCLTHTSAPARSAGGGRAYRGVGGIAAYTVRAAFSSSDGLKRR